MDLMVNIMDDSSTREVILKCVRLSDTVLLAFFRELHSCSVQAQLGDLTCQIPLINLLSFTQIRQMTVIVNYAAGVSFQSSREQLQVNMFSMQRRQRAACGHCYRR